MPVPQSLITNKKLKYTFSLLDFVYPWEKTVKQKGSVEPNVVKPFYLFFLV